MLYTWRTPDAEQGVGFRFLLRSPKHSFSLLVPARHEEAVLGETLDLLAASNYPDFEILVMQRRPLAQSRRR